MPSQRMAQPSFRSSSAVIATGPFGSVASGGRRVTCMLPRTEPAGWNSRTTARMSGGMALISVSSTGIDRPAKSSCANASGPGWSTVPLQVAQSLPIKARMSIVSWSFCQVNVPWAWWTGYGNRR